MSEFWVSKKRYWCKYCETYIADDAPSRSQHENGLRHKGNKERFVNKLYKHAEQKKKDAVEEQREMARVDQAARAAFASDVSSGHAKASSSALPPPRVPAAAAAASSSKPKPSSPWANYSTAQSLGYTDPDEERRAAEAERQRTQGVAGAWQIVEAPPRSNEPATEENGLDLPGEQSKSLKREAAAVVVDEDDTRSFKVRKKTWGGMDDLWDPADVPIKLKPKKVEELVIQSDETSTSVSAAPASSTLSEPGATSERPRWTTKGWNTPGTSSVLQTNDDASSITPEVTSTALTKVEDDLQPVKTEDTAEDTALAADVNPSPDVVKTEEVVKTETPDTAPPLNTSGMFRKRKAPAGSAGSRAKR